VFIDTSACRLADLVELVSNEYVLCKIGDLAYFDIWFINAELFSFVGVIDDQFGLHVEAGVKRQFQCFICCLVLY
jgi:hypothetical protein